MQNNYQKYQPKYFLLADGQRRREQKAQPLSVAEGGGDREDPGGGGEQHRDAMQDFCLDIGGFDAVVTSNLPAGSGLSSSAAFAVLMGKILNAYYNDGKLEPIVIARLAQQAENQHFGKPCGLMDQLASSLGSCVYVDFATDEILPIKTRFERRADLPRSGADS